MSTVTYITTAKQVRAFYETHGQPTDTRVIADDTVNLANAYESRTWEIVLSFADGATLRVSWSGYSRGYSELTPASPGAISFVAVEP